MRQNERYFRVLFQKFFNDSAGKYITALEDGTISFEKKIIYLPLQLKNAKQFRLRIFWCRY